MYRQGTYRVAIGFVIILVAALILGFTSPAIVDIATPMMQSASSPDRCVVVMKGCHGERVAINEQWKGVYDAVYNRGTCTEELRPIDAINYTARWDAGICSIGASLPADCEAEYGAEMCADMQDVLDRTYRD